MRTTIIYHGLRIMLVIFGIFAMGCSSGAELPEKTIKLTLGGPVERVEGYEWPIYSNGKLFEMTLVQQPAHISILIDGRLIESQVTGASFHQSEGQVTVVKLIDQRAGSRIDDALAQLDALATPFIGTIFGNGNRIDAIKKNLEERALNAGEGWPTEFAAPLVRDDTVEIRLGIRTFFAEGHSGLNWGAFVELFSEENE